MKLSGIIPNNVVRLDCTLDSLFRYWLSFLTMWCPLTDKEIIVASEYLKERYRLSKAIIDNNILNEHLMSKETQSKIIDKCGIKPSHFLVVKSKLKSKGFFKENEIEPKLIPNIREHEGYFQLLLLMRIKQDEPEGYSIDSGNRSESSEEVSA